MVSIFFMLT
ncbi:UNVERIFIED_CONTAM: hypothetical protein GTU68_052353 [Idotea baltica]|nr:hypothetical protein [Idotea baltica]